MQFAQMHQINGNTIVFKTKYENAVKNLETAEGESDKGDALTIQVKIGNNVTKRVLLEVRSELESPSISVLWGIL